MKVSVPLSGLTSVNNSNPQIVPRLVIKKVSVPLSGLTSVNGKRTFPTHYEECIVSVPLSGLTSVNFIKCSITTYNRFRFRPLIGVNFCKLSFNILIYQAGDEVSVPLSGLTSVNDNMDIWDIDDMGFRPLIGVNFCKLLYLFMILKMIESFRPLIGVNFCKRKIYMY